MAATGRAWLNEVIFEVARPKRGEAHAGAVLKDGAQIDAALRAKRSISLNITQENAGRPKRGHPSITCAGAVRLDGLALLSASDRLRSLPVMHFNFAIWLRNG